MTKETKIGRAPPLADQVVAALTADILEGKRQAGEKLPIEPDLAAAYGVSRTVIREAIARLRTDGLVVTRQGAGIYVAAVLLNRTFRMPAQSLENAAVIKEIFEQRMCIEVEAAAFAAQRRVPEDLVRMRHALVLIEATRTGPDFGAEGDVDFHRAIATATNNSKISSFQRYLSVFLVQSITAARRHTQKTLPDTAVDVTREHEAIFGAIDTGEADRAREAMRAHLLAAQGRLGLLDPEHRLQMERLR